VGGSKRESLTEFASEEEKKVWFKLIEYTTKVSLLLLYKCPLINILLIILFHRYKG